MSTLIDSARSAVYRDGMIVVTMDSGSEIRFPAKSNPRLARGTAAQISNIAISPFGLKMVTPEIPPMKSNQVTK